MTKKRVSINGITRWKEINPAPQQVAPVVEEAKTSSELLAWICQALDIPMYQMLREVADRMAILEGVHVPDTVPAELAEQYRNDYMMASL